MSVTGEAGGPPVRVGNSVADIGAAMWAVIGMLAALQARHTTGRGQWVDISLLDGQISWLTYLATGYRATGEVPQRYGSAHPTIVPYQALRTADGHLMCAVGNDTLWRRFAAVAGTRRTSPTIRASPPTPSGCVNREGSSPLSSRPWPRGLGRVGRAARARSASPPG